MEENAMDKTYFEDRLNLAPVMESMDKLKNEIRKIIVGQEKMIQYLMAAVLANGHVLIQGNPGVAKTLTARILARTISSDFSRIQFTPDLMPSDVLGTSVFNFKDSEFEFRKGPVFSNIVLIDEINRSPAKTQAALFEVMEERQVTNDGTTYPMEAPFMIVATQNPIELEGTYRLPEAQMDRFLFMINVDYPDLEEEIEIIRGFHEMKNTNDLSVVEAVISEAELLNYQEIMKSIVVEEKLIRYIAEIVHKTRNFRDIIIGASPRASLALLASSKAIALIQGRDFVTPDDIIEVTQPVLAHRITIAPEREMEGITTNRVIRTLVKSIEIPR